MVNQPIYHNEENGDIDYKVPDIRTVDIKSLDEVFNPLIFNAIDNVVSTKNNIMNGGLLESLLLPVENVEQLGDFQEKRYQL